MAEVNDLIENQPIIVKDTIIYANDASNTASLSRLAQSVHNLLEIVSKQVNNGSETLAYDHDTSITHIEGAYPKPQANSIVYADDLKVKKNLINSLGNDCICYADCTEFARWKYFTCGCNSDCGCNYFSVNND